MTKTDASKFSSLSIGLHWLMLLLLAAVYAFMELRGIFPKGGDAREAMKTWHYMLGLSVFILVCARIVARVIYATPTIQPVPPKWQVRFALAMHVALYALMIAMPILGWMLLSAEGKPIPLFGLHLPALVSESKPLADKIQEVHEIIGTTGYFLIGLHAAAALFHHYVVRDNTLRRMLPY
jgi:cytochrome b561